MDPDPADANSTSIDQSTAVRQLTVFLENRIGALLSIVDLLKRNHFLVLGLSVKDAIDATVVRFIVNDPESV